MKISAVIPCYYSDDGLIEVVDQIKCEIEKNQCDYEIVLVNDGSKNNTFEIISEIVKNNRNVIGIDLAQNVGQHNAIMAGFHYVTGDLVWICSDDGQSSLDALGEMLDCMMKGYDAVCAKFMDRGKRSIFRKMGTQFALMMSKVLIKHPDDVVFCIDMIMKKFVVDEMIKYTGPYSYIEGLLFRITQNVANIESVQKNRKSGKSGYTFRKLVSLWLNGFTAFSIKPLRISGLLGITFSGVGFIIAVIAVIQKIAGKSVQVGWTSLITIMLISFGIILIVLSLIGEYIGRIYLCINNTPQYVIKEVIDGKKGE